MSHFLLIRCVVFGGDPVHASLRLRPIPGSKRQRDSDDDNGLQVHLSHSHIQPVQKVYDEAKWKNCAAHSNSLCFHSLISRMLQRQPDKRANLVDIIADPWLSDHPPGTSSGSGSSSAGPQSTDSSFMLPLVSREHLREEDHAAILQKMVMGAIAPKEEIIE